MLGIAETNEKIPKTIECLIMANSANTSCLFDNSSVKLCKARHAVAVRTVRCEP